MEEELNIKIKQNETSLKNNIKQYEELNKTTLTPRETHIYSAAYWTGRLDARGI